MMTEVVILFLIALVILGVPLFTALRKRRQDRFFKIGSKVWFDWYDHGKQQGAVIDILHRKHGESPVFQVEFMEPESKMSGSIYLRSSAMWLSE